MIAEDIAYWTKRLAEERVRAEIAPAPAARAAHRELAQRYEARLKRLRGQPALIAVPADAAPAEPMPVVRSPLNCD